eukprot:s3767_g12.t1
MSFPTETEILASAVDTIENEVPLQQTSMKENRCLMAQARAWDKMDPRNQGCMVAELFSPPRFSKVANELNREGLAFDILQGWHLNRPSVQQKADALPEKKRPELLVACPPCKHWGGWFRLNQLQLTLLEKCRLQRIARKQALCGPTGQEAVGTGWTCADRTSVELRSVEVSPHVQSAEAVALMPH